MTKKFALFAFNGEECCFLHVILNALEMNEKGYDVKVIIEGEACKLAGEFENKQNPKYSLYKKLWDSGLIDCFCKACSNMMETLDIVEKLEFPTCSEMSGHPSMLKYIEKGYEIITF
ncbi:MAG: cytoplasmic protein [Candidatus Lokiarchaeota archaeon]|nr:cytoplasmic protein [Candidatus Lokiarchaeota archaeon]MBD3201712.1 cytoplasmic protein [Candidatus Lokiarchaeota archaeon]